MAPWDAARADVGHGGGDGDGPAVVHGGGRGGRRRAAAQRGVALAFRVAAAHPAEDDRPKPAGVAADRSDAVGPLCLQRGQDAGVGAASVVGAGAADSGGRRDHMDRGRTGVYPDVLRVALQDWPPSRRRWRLAVAGRTHGGVLSVRAPPRAGRQVTRPETQVHHGIPSARHRPGDVIVAHAHPAMGGGIPRHPARVARVVGHPLRAGVPRPGAADGVVRGVEGRVRDGARQRGRCHARARRPGRNAVSQVSAARGGHQHVAQRLCPPRDAVGGPERRRRGGRQGFSGANLLVWGERDARQRADPAQVAAVVNQDSAGQCPLSAVWIVLRPRFPTASAGDRCDWHTRRGAACGHPVAGPGGCPPQAVHARACRSV
mmetsp:Transcript_27429/g.72038  ORF Transcript_27429/g.72038 Transcript_27429/m.72038 type:complete len:375 (+) Transcript_27429:1163-2287(+)